MTTRSSGFEPWEEFPVNRGMLCPKGVKRYLQNEHPDRLLAPLIRTHDGFREATWDEALDRTVDAIRRIQAQYGRDAFAMLGGASMTNEKAYLIGKFARVALRTANIDYNGRLCMVSAGAANKMAFGVDRAANPWSDIPLAKAIIISRRQHRRVLSDPDRLRLASARQRRKDHRHRSAHDADRPHRRPLPAGAARTRQRAGQRNSARHDRTRLGRSGSSSTTHTHGIRASRESSSSNTRRSVPKRSPACPRQASSGRRKSGARRKPRCCCTRAASSITPRASRTVLSYINLVLASGRIGKPGCGYGTITGQGNGQGGREHGQRCNQLPGARDIENPEHRKFIADFWRIAESELPRTGLTACEIFDAIEAGKSEACCRSASIRWSPFRMRTARARRWKSWSFFGCIDFFLSETARHADVVLAGSLQEEDEGTVTTGEGRCVRLQQSVTPPGDARVDWQILVGTRRRGWATRTTFPTPSPTTFSANSPPRRKGGSADYSGMTYAKIEKNMGIFWPCPSSNHPGTPRLFEGGKFHHADGKARFYGYEYRPPAEDVDAEYPLFFTTGRVVSQYLSGNQTRRIGPLVDQYPEPLVRNAPVARSEAGNRGRRHRPRRHAGAVRSNVPAQVVRTIRPDTVFVPYHWPGKKSANLLTNRALDPISKIPEYKVCACRMEKVT